MKMTQSKVQIVTLLLLLPELVQCDFETNFQSCHQECFNKDGLVNCISDDFKSSHCCEETDTDCMKNYNYCSLGLTSEAYKYFTCPTFMCPFDGEPMRIYHDKLNEEQIHEISWSWGLGMSVNCRVQVHADPSLNGKLNVQIVQSADQTIHVYQQPKSFSNNFNKNSGPWGLYEPGKVNSFVQINHHEQVPTDWQIFVEYYIMHWMPFNSKKIKLKTYVEEFVESDQSRIQSEWRPTSAEYLTPQQKQIQEELQTQRLEQLRSESIKEFAIDGSNNQQGIDQMLNQLDKKHANQIRKEKEEVNLQKQESIELTTVFASSESQKQWKEPSQTIQMNSKIITIIILVLCLGCFIGFGCGAFYFFKIRKRDNSEQNGSEKKLGDIKDDNNQQAQYMRASIASNASSYGTATQERIKPEDIDIEELAEQKHGQGSQPFQVANQTASGINKAEVDDRFKVKFANDSNGPADYEVQNNLQNDANQTNDLQKRNDDPVLESDLLPSPNDDNE